jgi:hypothetical protein
LQRIIFDLKRAGIGILVTDHNVSETLAVTDRAYIINDGRIFRAGSPEALARDPEVGASTWANRSMFGNLSRCFRPGCSKLTTCRRVPYCSIHSPGSDARLEPRTATAGLPPIELVVSCQTHHAQQSASLYAPMARCSRRNASQAISADIGMVSTHAHTILVAMPQRTAFRR